VRSPRRLCFATIFGKASQCIGVDRLGQIAKPIHRPPLLSVILKLEESPRRIGGKDTEAQIDRYQISHGLHVVGVTAHMAAIQQYHVPQLMCQRGYNGQRVFEE